VDRYHLGITTGASLIRRKAAFGTELIENIEQLALVIVGLEDKYKLTQFHENRLQMIIALLVAQPIRMGQWFTFTIFDADVSQSQRSAILTALGLSARELAGYGEEDARIMNLPTLLEQTKKEFPTQQLPPELEKMYISNDENPVAALTNQMARSSLKPLALDAADALSGPNALKVRTFSSRMEVERQRQQRETQRKKKSTSENLHKVLTIGYFYPLIGRFEALMQSSL
jgi:telomere length regulation protein